MTLIRRNSPFGELLSLRQAMDRLFDDSFIRPGTMGESAIAPALDVYSTDDAVVIEAALPGVRPEDVDIAVLGDTLTISGSMHAEKSSDEEGYSYREIRRGNFSRSLTLPGGLNAEAARAEFENGLLRLSIPKAEEARPRQIKINPTSDGRLAESAGAPRENPGEPQPDGSQAGGRT